MTYTELLQHMFILLTWNIAFSVSLEDFSQVSCVNGLLGISKWHFQGDDACSDHQWRVLYMAEWTDFSSSILWTLVMNVEYYYIMYLNNFVAVWFLYNERK